MKRKDLIKFYEYLQSELMIEPSVSHWEADTVACNFLNSLARKDKTPKVITNEDNGNVCDNYKGGNMTGFTCLNCGRHYNEHH